MTLDEAMRRNGVEGPAPDGVGLRLAPPQLRRLWIDGVSAMATPNAIWVGPQAMAAIQAGSAAGLLRHELTHVAQWRREGPVRFLGRYLADYLLARAGGFPHRIAYRAIRFERAAVAAERPS